MKSKIIIQKEGMKPSWNVLMRLDGEYSMEYHHYMYQFFFNFNHIGYHQ